MQIGVSVKYASPDNLRILHRGGGADGSDWLKGCRNGQNCTSLCFVGIQWGSMDGCGTPVPYYGGADPYYLRCFDAIGASPLNGKRIQLASQEATAELDPALVKMNLTERGACYRMY